MYRAEQLKRQKKLGLVPEDAIRMGELDNTLVIYLTADNGCTAEGTPTGTFSELLMQNGFSPLTMQQQLEKLEEFGGLEAWGGPHLANHYSVAWAYASSTPFQWTKQMASHFGGTISATAVHYPKGIKARGQWRRQFQHVTDIVPTILEVTGVLAPDYVNGQKRKDYPGKSLTYAWNDPDAKTNGPSTVEFFINDKRVGEMDITATVYGSFTGHETFDVGMDTSAPVATDYFDKARLMHGAAPGPIEALLVGAVTDVMDCDTVRVAAIVDSLPPMVLTLLLLIAAATVCVAGFNAGLSGRISRWRTTLLILVLASIILVILDFDRSIDGFIHVSNDSIDAVIAEMEEGLARDQAIPMACRRP